MRWGEHLHHLNNYTLLTQLIEHIRAAWGENTPEYLYLQSFVASNNDKWKYLQQLHQKFPYHICSEKSLKTYLMQKHRRQLELTYRELDRLVAQFLDNEEYDEAVAILNADTSSHIYLRILVYEKQRQYDSVVQNAKIYLRKFSAGEFRDRVLWKLAYTLSHRLQKCAASIAYYDDYIDAFPEGKHIANVLIAKGDSCVCIGENASALQAYLQVASTTDKPHLLHIAYYSAGNILVKNNDPQARVLLQKALQYRGPYTQKIEHKLKKIENE